MQVGDLIKGMLENGSLSENFVLRVLRPPFMIKIKGARKDVAVVETELVSGKIPIGFAYKVINRNDETLYVVRVSKLRVVDK